MILSFYDFPMYWRLWIFTNFLFITGDFEFLRNSACTGTLSFYDFPMYWGLWVFSNFPSYNGDFAFLLISSRAGDFCFLRVSLCTGKFFKRVPTYWGLWIFTNSHLYWDILFSTIYQRLCFSRVFPCTEGVRFYKCFSVPLRLCFYKPFSCIGDFYLLRNPPWTGDIWFERKQSLQGFFSVLKTLSFSICSVPRKNNMLICLGYPTHRKCKKSIKIEDFE